MDATLLIVLFGAALAGFAQGVSGFAFALVALSVWAWAVEPQLAAPMSVFGALVGQVVVLPWVWRGFSWTRLWPLLVGGVLGVPLGVLLLHWMDPDIFKFALGCFLLVYCPVMLLFKPRPEPAFNRVADGFAGFAGGVLGGIGGMSGPVPTLWTTIRGWGKDLQRGMLMAFNIAMHVCTMGAYVLTGSITHEVLVMFAWITPALIIPAIVGVQLFHRLNQQSFRRMILVLLTLSGLALVLGSAQAVFG
ncbi:MAG: sulfite exporter TauE/SafE family protein [Mesorhizobium sp.]